MPVHCENETVDEDNLLLDAMKRVLSSVDCETNKQVREEICAVFKCRGIDLFDMTPSESVICHIICHSKAALQHLYDIINEGSLTATVQEMFDQLVGGRDIVHVVRTCAQLTTLELEQRITEFSEDVPGM